MRLKTVVFILLFLAAGIVSAQEFRATIAGHVLDPTGAAVPGAKVQAINVATNETTTATTDNSGTYSIPFLRPGGYKLTATKEGFKTFVRENITLQVNQQAGIEVTLEVGSVAESVEVTAEVALLETQSASRGGVVNTMQVAEIPLNARNPFMLGAIMPGVTFNGAAIWQRPFDNGAIAEWSINGSRTRRNEFLLDGASNNSQAGDNNIAYVPIVDAVQEFNVQMNSYNAEYGHTGGGIFNVVLKSGGNTFHATGWEYMRRTALDANTFQNNAIGAKKTTHYLDQYGGQVEGPLVIPKLMNKDGRVKLFYLGSFENYREGTPNPLLNSYPEPEMRTGDFSKLTDSTGKLITIYDPFNYNLNSKGDPVRVAFPANKIPAERINPIAKAVTQYMPLPNSAPPPTYAYSHGNLSYPNYFDKDKFYNLILKFDWNFGDRHRAFIRHASNDRTEDRSSNGIDNKPGTDGQQPFQRINDAYVVDWVSNLSPTFIVNVRGAYNRFIEKGLGAANKDFDLTKLGISSSLLKTLPGPIFFGRWEFDGGAAGGYANLGRGQDINITNNYGLQGNVTKIAGKHTVKGGLDLRRIHYITQGSGNILYFQGQNQWTRKDWKQASDPNAPSGDSYASFLIGGVKGSSNYPLYPFWRQWYSALYAQDDWKFNRRLTLNLGLRWDLNMRGDEKWNRMIGPFDPNVASPIAKMVDAQYYSMYPQLQNLKGAMTFAGVNGVPSRPWHTPKTMFQPRLGFAYQLRDRWVMRGGAGMYIMNPDNAWMKTNGFSTSSGVINSNDGGRTLSSPDLLSNPYPGGILRPVGASQGPLSWVGRDFSWYNPDYKLPKIWQFSYGFQYQVSQTSTVDFSYVGSRTWDGEMEKDINTVPKDFFFHVCDPLTGGTVADCDALVPNPFKGLDPFKGQNMYTADKIKRFDTVRPYMQFPGGLKQQGRNESKIWYNAFQVVYKLRLRNGLDLLGNYNFSKQIEQWGYNDVYNLVQQRGLYFLDRPHSFKLTAIYQLPFGKGKKFASGAGPMLDRIIGGWEYTTLFIDQSGRPADLPDNVIMLKDPRKPAGNWDGKIDWKAYQPRGWSPCVLRMFDDGNVKPQQFSLDQGCSATDFSNYAWLMLPNYAKDIRYTTYRSGQIRVQHAFQMDASLNKTISISERAKAQIGFEAFNALNHNYWGRESWNKDPNSTNFGTVRPGYVSTQNGMPRQFQIRMKFMW